MFRSRENTSIVRCRDPAIIPFLSLHQKGAQNNDLETDEKGVRNGKMESRRVR